MRTGVLISDKGIKAVKIVGKKPVLVNVPLEAGVLVNGEVKEKDKFKNALIKLSSQLSLSGSEVVLGISEKHIFSKAITLKDHEIDFEEKIKEELETYVPEGGQSYTDWQVLKRSSESETIFVASAPASLLDAYITLFDEASIMVAGIEPITVALCRHLPKSQPTVVAGNVTNHPSVKQGEKSKEPAGGPVQTPAPKTTNPPSYAASTLLIVLEENDVLLSIIDDKGHIALTSVLPQESIGHANELLTEISNMRSFYDKKNETAPIGRVYTTGEGATEELKNQLSSQLGIPSEFLKMPFSSISLQNALAFFPVFSLADLPIVPAKNHENINLLPVDLLLLQERIRRKRTRVRLMSISAGFFGVMCVLYIFVLALLFWNNRQIDSELTALQTRAQTSDALATRKKASLVNKNISIIEKFRLETSSPLEVLAFLAEKTPGGIVITHYSINLVNKTVLLSGQSLERDRLLAFRGILENEGKFRNIRIPLASLEKRGVSTFSLSFEVQQ